MFKNLIEVTQYFSSKEVCVEYLTNIRWNGGAITCPHCGKDKIYALQGATKRFKCATCRKQFSATKGTIFENSPISLQKWFTAIYLLTAHKKGISSLQLSRDISVTQKTAWFMLQRIRFALKTKSFASPVMTTTVECDETYVGGKMKNKHKSKRVEGTKGRSVKVKAPVFGLVERNGRVVAMVVKDTAQGTIQPIIEKHVAKGAEVMTDEWRAYAGLHKNYTHSIVQHADGVYVIGKAHTNTIEGFWSLLKRGINGIYHQVSIKHLDKYVDEFEFRYNSRDKKDFVRFESMLSLANTRLTYQNLIA